jgi:hypothetical protein
MEPALKHDECKLSTRAFLIGLNKLLVMCIAWLLFFYLVLLGWDMQIQQEQIRPQSPFGNHEPTAPNTAKGGIEK